MSPAILLACLALSAPAPLPRSPSTRQASGSNQVTPGEWVLEWDGAAVPCTLSEDGTYAWGPVQRGMWRWDARTRTLSVVEWPSWDESRLSVLAWSVRLDARLESIDAGKAPGSNPRVRLWKKGRGP